MALGMFEEAVLMCVWRLKDAYGAEIRRELSKRLDKDVAYGAVYTTLDRLEEKGFVSSWMGEPTAERGGRSKRFFKIEAAGQLALQENDQLRTKILSLPPDGALA